MNSRSPRTWSFLAVLLLVLSSFAVAGPAAADQTISSPGPLTAITTSTDLNCAVNHVDDSQGEFFSDTACGTFAALNGVLYGPASIPAGGSLGSYVAYTPVAQGLEGAGTVGDPYRITTVVALGDTGVEITQLDTYVTGQATFRTDINVANGGSQAQTGFVYRAADCYLANSDSGLGTTGGGGRVGCTNTTRAEEFIPITGGSTYYEARYSEVWAAVAAKGALANTCRCTEMIDNGMALAWPVNVGAGSGQANVATATSFGTASGDAGQIDLVSSNPQPTTDEQGRHVFTFVRNRQGDLTITIAPEAAEGCTIVQVFMTHAGLQFEMTDPEGDGTYTGTIPADSLREGDITFTVIDDCGNQVTGSIGRVVFYDPSGQVTDEATGQPVEGATVTLYNVPGWTAQTPGNTGPTTCETTDTRGPDGWSQPAPTDDGQVASAASGTFTPDVNPEVTNDEGRYGWDVVTGCWYVTVSAPGYATETSPVVGVPPAVTDLDIALTPGGATEGVVRLFGNERIATAIAISQDLWTAGSASVVLLARHDNFPDSLAGGPMAVASGGPLLLTPSDGLWADTATEIQRVLPAGGTVVLLGGVAALSEDVALDLMDLGFTVQRADGATRYHTAVMVAESTRADPTTVFVADGNTFADALLASSAAPAVDGVVVLVSGTTIPDVVADYLDAHNGATWVAVGPAASAALPNADSVYDGSSVYDTSQLMASAFWAGATGFAVASGENFPDALSGSAHSGARGVPLLLSPKAGMTPEVLGWLTDNAPFTQAWLYGGPAALAETVAQQAAEALS